MRFPYRFKQLIIIGCLAAIICGVPVNARRLVAMTRGTVHYTSRGPSMESSLKPATVTALFESLNAAIAAGDVERAMEHFDPAAEATIRDMRSLIANATGRGDGCELIFRPTAGGESPGNHEWTVYRIYRYTEHGRSQSMDAWQKWVIAKSGTDWTVRDVLPLQTIRPDFTEIDVAVNVDDGMLRGKASIRFTVLQPGTDTLLVALNRGLSVTSLTDEAGNDLPYSRVADQIRIQQPERFIRKGMTDAVKIRYTGGLFNESSEKGYSQVHIGPEGSFASWVTNWYPNLDCGISKSIGRVTIRVPEGLDVVCNGKKARTTGLDGSSRFIFDITSPLDYTFAAAPYTCRETTVDGVQVGAYFLSDRPGKADLDLEKSAELIDFLKELYGGYPFDSYYIVEIPSAVTGNLGGSSEQGMNLFPDKMLPDGYFNLPLFAHEIGHSWWGNLVNGSGTPFTDEGLAQLTAILAVEHFHGTDAMRRFLRVGYPHYMQSALLYFALIAGDETFDIPIGIPKNGMRSILHLLSDIKGHYALNTLRERLGHDTFVRGLRQAIDTHSGKRMSLDDFRRAMEHAAGQPLDTIFDQWFYRSGAPELALAWAAEPDAAGYCIDGTVSQAVPARRKPYDLMVDVLFTGDAGETHTERVHIDSESHAFRVRLPFKPVDGTLDPEHKILRWTPWYRQLQEIQPLLRDNVLLSKDIETFEQQIRSYVKKHPDDALAWIALGQFYSEKDDSEAAMSAYRESLKRDRTGGAVDDHWVAMALMKLGELYNETGQRDAAVDCYQSILALPDLPEYHEGARGAIQVLQDAPVTTKPPC